MCGICGKVNFDHQAPIDSDLLRSMARSIAHRGPDDEGFYIEGAVGLGFRRLSIIDLAAGHQPLANEDESVWIVFNGEIYNYLELREVLVQKGHVFRTHTDTEVIVHLYEEYGEACVEQLRGMFAFAIWDSRAKQLFLARDRVGIKPLYYYLSDKSLIFASEVKAILCDPQVPRDVAPEVIDRFLMFYFVPGEETLLRGIFKLMPGHCMTVRDGKAVTRQYWDLDFTTAHWTDRQAEEQLRAILDESVRLHMISDVPVGFLLSGGFDSTALLSIASKQSKARLSTFTLGFSNPGLADERPYAQLAADAFGADHHEMTITAQEFADFLPKFAWYMEEPVCEPQAVALYYVTRLATRHVKVLISGEGGDEAFAGYPIYRNVQTIERLKRLFGPARHGISKALQMAEAATGSHRLRKYAPLVGLPFESFYFSRTYSPSAFFNRKPGAIYSEQFRGSANREKSLNLISKWMRQSGASGFVNRMLYMDTKTSLPDDLLLKADKMTMANSIELRVPFLDHRLLEFAASLPEHQKVHQFRTKYIAKKALSNQIPEAILRRKKVGFPVPYDQWMRGELRDWARDLLLAPNAQTRTYFDRGSVDRLLRMDEATKGYPKEVLSLVALELWHQAFLSGQGTGIGFQQTEQVVERPVPLVS